MVRHQSIDEFEGGADVPDAERLLLEGIEGLAATRHERDSAGGEAGIRQLAARFGVSTRSLRFYEEKGLLSPERRRGQRIYSRYDIERLKLILMGKRVSLTLAEICEILALHDRGVREDELLDVILEKLHEQAEFLREQEEAVQEALSQLDRTRRAADRLKRSAQHAPHVAQGRDRQDGNGRYRARTRNGRSARAS